MQRAYKLTCRIYMQKIDSIGRKESAIREILIDCDASNDRTNYLSTESNISSTGSKLNKCE